MRQSSTNAKHHWRHLFAGVFVLSLFFSMFSSKEEAPTKKASATTANQGSTGDAQGFSTPQQAADTLIDAAGKFDVPELTHIFGSDLEDVIFSGEYAQDRKHAADFVAQAREK